jgi:catechol 2,3-dioxygenase-like lactoylglutathione lyase family enzyme
MKSTIGHLQINIHLNHLGFYKGLFTFLGWKVIYDTPEMLGVLDPNNASLWFAEVTKKVANDYDGIGMNHLAISVPNQSDVDETVAYLKQQAISCLFETPRHRPEFCSEGKTYYQVMFESPDRILFEVVFTGPKQ